MHIMLSATNFCDPVREILPGVPFGKPEWVPSPAFWLALAAKEGAVADDYVSPTGTPLHEDVAFCVLGGFGVKMELNRAAWEHLRAARVFDLTFYPDPILIEALLREPLAVGGRMLRYRFPKQRAHRLAVALLRLHDWVDIPRDSLELRTALMKLPGIGPKTASWIVRNWSGSDDVAILDVHVIRAGQLMGLFPKAIKLPKDYDFLERRFLDFARVLGIRPSLLDALIWREMRVLYQ